LKPINNSLAIIGPTASGKSSVAVEIAKRIKGEIIGLDSRQIYKDMAIGTAQPSIKEQRGVVHHLIGIKPPSETISAGAYSKLVLDVAKDIKSRNHIPVLCGGSGLYYRALTQGIFDESKTDLKIRKELENEYDQHGSETLMSKLISIDPDYAKNVHPNNKKRLIRALEIYQSTGKTPTQNYNKQSNSSKNNTLDLFTIYLEWEKSELNNRIKTRTKEMLKAGWIDEVKKLLKDYSDAIIPPLDSIGYREIVSYIDDNTTLRSLEKTIAIKTRQFSVRQIKWFNKESIDLTIKMKSNKFINQICDQVINEIQR
jgi:tRNA dimethylallyltransferase|tara:strand:- start:3112 stop:4050 length:939 start_codon:yes stop_codon:yes gene_type:complete